MSGPRMGMSQMNGTNSRRPPNNIQRMPSNERTITQHDDLIKYIYDSWSKVESDRGSNNVMYYADIASPECPNVKDFQPFDLEAYWGRRLVSQQAQNS